VSAVCFVINGEHSERPFVTRAVNWR